MRIHAASTSEAVLRTLNVLITASGHDSVEASDAELLLVDYRHPTSDLPTLPTIGLGAAKSQDDGLSCPFRPQQLLRLLAAKRAGQTLPLGAGWSVDLLARTITHAKQSAVTLTEKEAALLGALVQAQPAPIGREALLAEVWGMRGDIDTHTLETHIYRLRAKLSALTPIPCDIVTEDGAYKIVEIAA